MSKELLDLEAIRAEAVEYREWARVYGADAEEMMGDLCDDIEALVAECERLSEEREVIRKEWGEFLVRWGAALGRLGR